MRLIIKNNAWLSLLLFVAMGCSHAETHETTFSDTQAPRAYTRASDMPVEEFFRNPAVYSFRVSPDGKMVASMRPWKNRLNIFVAPIDRPDQLKQVTFVTDRDLRGPDWKGPDHILYARDTGGDENDHVFVVNIHSGKVRDLTPFPGSKSWIEDGLEEVSPTDILVSNNKRNPEYFDLYRVNVETGAIQMVAENKDKIGDWLIDHEGHPRGGIASDGVNTVFFFEKAKGEGFKPVFKTGFRTAFAPMAFTADNKRVYVSTNLGSDVDRLVEIDPNLPEKKFILRTLFKHPKYDMESAAYSEVRKTIGPVTIVTDRREIKFLHPDDQKDWAYLKAQLGGGGLLLANTSRDERIWIVKTHLDTSRGAYYAFNRDSRKTTNLGEVSPWLRPDLLAPMKTIKYRSRDGLDIEAFLTLPRGKDPVQLPFVIFPHGGPWARDEWGYDTEAQFLASRGYGVLQMNFRGSTGYGRKFWESSFKQWGQKMQDDITDGVKYLVRKGLADPKRVCIYGGSYGGYATLAGVTFTPDLYACGVDYVGVSNLFTFLESIPPYWKPYLDQMYEMVGHPKRDAAMLRAASPVFHVDRIKAPLFVAQGANDPRVKKSESDQIVEALRKRGVEVQYMVKHDEGHGFANEENRFDFYRAMEKFLEKHLNGGPAK